jgi:hypothetical protein
VREESHLEDMRSAIRGDFERLAERLGDQELMRVVDGEDPDPPEGGEAFAPVPAPEAEAEPKSEPQPQPAPEEPRRSWLARFLSP